jgi:electron transport complex protein RnfB
MEDIESIYCRLADHLEGLPGGFSPSDTGEHIHLLRHLFTPEEAELATHLTLDREGAREIAERANLSVTETERRLEEMAEKGLIFSVKTVEGPILYQAAPWVIGIYEFQVNRLDEELLQKMDNYWSTSSSVERPKTIPQMRTIPVNESIDPQLDVLPYENVEELVRAHEKFAVAPCICRTKEKKMGRGCDAPTETCLIFGDFADFYVRTGRGRKIEMEEMRDLLVKANEANLVLNPTNSMFVSAICCCCGDCCGILRGLQSHPKPSEAVASSFIVSFEEDACAGCGTCLDRCQMQAISPGESGVSVNTDRCIGCGLCVSTCPTGALKLRRKPESASKEMPGTFFETWYTIARDQAKEI